MTAGTRACLGVLLALGLAPQAHASLSAREIMERVDERDRGKTLQSDVEMTITYAGGQRRVRRLQSFTKTFGDDTHQLLYVMFPKDVRNSAFLTYDYASSQRQDDQWLYLPALHKSRRIAGVSRSASFFGSDFSYADLATIPIDTYTFELLGEGEVRGHPVWQVQATPDEAERKRTGYRDAVYFVRKDIFVVVRALYRSQRSGRAKYLDVTGLDRVRGVWVATDLKMVTRDGGAEVRRTILRNRNIRVNDPIDDAYFNVRYLQRGPPEL